MFYHIPQDYGERYIIPFQDVNGNDWKVSISQPNYAGSVVTLTGAEFPVEWSGRGDESQDEVVLGSTGTIRLVCKNATEKDTVFVKGALLPSAINDCRVQICKRMNNVWQIYWQGFIQPQTFSQDWDSTPYEIELPIISVVAAMEYFPMPSPFPDGAGSNFYDYFMEQSTIGGLLRAIFVCTGCEIRRIVTNKPNYQDFNGELVYHGETPMHWTEGIVSPGYFYENESGDIRPKTFKDVLETLCYPLGKIQEYNLDVAFLLRWKPDANNDARLYSFSVWEDYDNSVYATSVHFGDYSPIYKLPIANLKPAGTDNTHSFIQPPARIKFTSDEKSDKEVFSFSESNIKSTYKVGTTLPTPHEQSDFSGKNRFVFPINKNDVDMSFAEDWEFESDMPELLDYPFCRVIEVTADNSAHTFSSSKTIELGLSFNIYSPPDLTRKTSSTKFTIPQGIKTTVGINNIQLTVKPYHIREENPTQDFGGSLLDYARLKISIQDLSNGKFLKREGDVLSWVNDRTATAYPLNEDNNEFTLHFCEERLPGDNLLHKLRIGVMCETTMPQSPLYTYSRMFCDIKLEYAEENRMTKDEHDEWTYNAAVAVLAPLAKGITDKANIEVNGGGDEDMSFELKTMAGNRNIVTDDRIRLPQNSFNDYFGYVDTGERELIEIDTAQFERYNLGYIFDLVSSYAVVTDGSKVFIPVAVGMNPRMNTLKLTLVSTNVTT